MNARKHRRRLAGTVLVAVLLTFAYWRLSRPEIDPRLIGRWTIHHPLDKSWPPPMVEFRPDGTATWWSSDISQSGENAPRPMRWSARGDRFNWRFEHDSLRQTIRLEFDRLRYRWSDPRGVAPHERLYEIAEVRDDEIAIDHLAPDNSTDRFTFRREH